MALNRYCVLLIFVSFLMAAPGARGQPMNDGEACLEGNGQSLLDEAYCRRALSRPGLAAAERAALLTARAAALARLGEGREAGIEIARALALNPGSAQAHFVRGVLAPNGMADLDRAIALNPFFCRRPGPSRCGSFACPRSHPWRVSRRPD
mgnify:CR=1 FL=1